MYQDKQEKLMIEFAKAIEDFVLNNKKNKQQYIDICLSNDSNEQKIQQIQLLLVDNFLEKLTSPYVRGLEPEYLVHQIKILRHFFATNTLDKYKVVDSFFESLNDKLTQIPDIKDQIVIKRLIIDAVPKVMKPAKEHEDLISSIGKVIRYDCDDDAKIKAITYILC